MKNEKNRFVVLGNSSEMTFGKELWRDIEQEPFDIQKIAEFLKEKGYDVEIFGTAIIARIK